MQMCQRKLLQGYDYSKAKKRKFGLDQILKSPTCECKISFHILIFDMS